jgi:hypothetical protein
MKKKHNEEGLYNVYSAADIITVSESRGLRYMRLVGYGKHEIAYRILVENSKGRDHMRDLGVC